MARAVNSAFNAFDARMRVAEKANMSSGGDIVSVVMFGASEIHGLFDEVSGAHSHQLVGAIRRASAQGAIEKELERHMKRLSAVANALRLMTPFAVDALVADVKSLLVLETPV